jgi:hypothetical protein
MRALSVSILRTGPLRTGPRDEARLGGSCLLIGVLGGIGAIGVLAMCWGGVLLLLATACYCLLLFVSASVSASVTASVTASANVGYSNDLGYSNGSLMTDFE